MPSQISADALALKYQIIINDPRRQAQVVALISIDGALASGWSQQLGLHGLIMITSTENLCLEYTGFPLPHSSGDASQVMLPDFFSAPI